VIGHVEDLGAEFQLRPLVKWKRLEQRDIPRLLDAPANHTGAGVSEEAERRRCERSTDGFLANDRLLRTAVTTL
jgi:hypothetical protein